MKTLLTYFLGLFLCLGSLLHASAQTEPLLQDTLSIQIGTDKQVIILVKDKQALRSLQNYDLNRMVRDLNQKADSLENRNTIVITDEEGNRYRIAYSIKTAGSKQDSTQENKDDDKSKNINIVINQTNKSKEHKVSHYSRTRSSLNFDLGVNNYLQDGKFPQEDDAQYAVKSWGSWYVGINQVFKTQIAGPLALQWGGGISWYNFKFEDPSTRLTKTSEGVEFGREISTEINSQKSKLTASFIGLQAVPMLDFGYRRKVTTNDDGSKRVSRWHDDKAFRVGLGGYAGYRLGSYTKYKYELNNDTKKDRDRGSYYLNNWRYGVRMQVGYKGMDLFAQYDLNELFVDNRGPQLNAFSFGITF